MDGARVTRVTGRLSDGREIIHFGRAGDPPAEMCDPRLLRPVPTEAELRYDPVLDEWVVMASHRQDRTHLPGADECPLCPSRDGRETEIPLPDYGVAVFENRFPSLTTDAGGAALGVFPDLLEVAPGHGRCEVVCFTSEHDASFATLDPDHARLVVEAWADRTEELARLPGVEQVFCFENRGSEVGVTLEHPHGQIYAYPFVTPRTRQMLDSARRYAARTGRELFADVLAAERASKDRLVCESAHWAAFVPAAARWPVEVHLYPHCKVPDIPALSPAERDDFVLLYLDVLARLDTLYDRPLPYVAAWHQAPVRWSRGLAYLHLQVFSVQRSPDKLKYLAGSEAAMGAFVNDVLPEELAERLRS